MPYHGPRASLLGAALILTLAASTSQAAPISAIGIENQYADIIAQIGGPFVRVTAIETDPNTDPHEFEVSPRIAEEIAGAGLVVENGLGYDGWADKMLAATVNPARQTIVVQALVGLPDSTENPHLWYAVTTMPTLAYAIAASLAELDPAHAQIFEANAKKFEISLIPVTTAINAFKHDFPNTKIAVTEPVGDDLLQSAGADIVTPWTLQAAIMNGTDPAPQDVTTETALLTSRRAKIFVYDQQVTDPLTESFLALAKQNNIPVIGVYETMPAPGYIYQSWMLAELAALRAALTTGTSTPSLLPAP
jgi:zinc/manganese transport system substrate-binding protein